MDEVEWKGPSSLGLGQISGIHGHNSMMLGSVGLDMRNEAYSQSAGSAKHKSAANNKWDDI